MKFAALLAVSTLAAAPALAQTTGPQAQSAPQAAPALPPGAEMPQPPQPSPEQAKAAEAALRKVIAQFAADKPDYSGMTDELRDRITPKADQVHNILTGLGAVQTVSVLGMDDQGVIYFRVVFEHAAFDWAILLNPDGKLGALALRPSQTEG